MKKSILFLFLSIFILLHCASQNSTQSAAFNAFSQGAKSYQEGDWTSCVFMLRRATSYTQNYNADTYYMLIMAEVYSKNYSLALTDCDTFIKNWPESSYISNILYQRGLCLFYQGEYEKSILQLSDFCHDYPKHEMYPAALYWIAESFFVNYNYEDAEVLYKRIVKDYSESERAALAQYRLETITQSRREERLLYLLKQLGEEYLTAKEEYERQIQENSDDNLTSIRQRLEEVQHKNILLQEELDKLKGSAEKSDKKGSDSTEENKKRLEELKKKAIHTRELLDKSKE